MKKSDWGWIVAIVAAVVIWKLFQPTTVSSTSSGQPIAGAGIDPFDTSAYTVEEVADLGGIFS